MYIINTISYKLAQNFDWLIAWKSLDCPIVSLREVFL